MHVDTLKIFALLAELKSMTKVSLAFGVSVSNICRKMQSLENSLNTKLFFSYSGGIILTDHGELFSTQLHKILHQLEAAKMLTQDMHLNSGPLDIYITGFGMHGFGGLIQEFIVHHPDVEVRLILSNDDCLFHHSHLNGIFVGLTSHPPLNNTPLIWTQLGENRWHPYASAPYLALHNTPKTFNNLETHQLIKYNKPSSRSSFISEEDLNPLLLYDRPANAPRQHTISVDSAAGCLELITHHVGIGLLPECMATRSHELVPLLQGAYDHTQGLYKQNTFICYQPFLRHNGRVKAFREFINKKVYT